MNTPAIQHLLSQTAQRFRDRVAIEWRGRQVTYAELESATNRLANFLIDRGVEKGARVAILVHDRVKMIEAMTGTLKAGAVFVPLDAGEPDKRLERMIREVEPRWFIVESLFIEKLTALAAATGPLKALIIDEAERAARLSEDANEAPPAGRHEMVEYLNGLTSYAAADAPQLEAGPDDMCYIFFTSGSTGSPKGIAGRLQSLLHFIRWETATFGIDHTWRTSQFAVPTFDAYLRDLFVPLCNGATLCIPDGRETILDPRQLARWIEASRVNLIHCVPSVFRALLGEPLAGAQFAALRTVIMAGERIFPADVKRWTDVFGERIRLVNLYGATENTMAKFCYFIEAADQQRRSIPIGKPIAGAKAILLDDHGKPCDPGAVGEIHIRTPFLTLGYFNRPELTERVFIPNPFGNDPADRVHKTGDLGRALADGNYELIGRKDHQVKIRGQRVELGEIEAVLKQHAGVREAAAVVKEAGPDDQRLMLYFVAAADQEISLAELRRHLTESLPDHMLPSALMQLAAMPLTRTGKIDRNALPEPDDARSQLEEAYVAPRDEIEERLAAIWAATLRLARVGIHDNFFQLGGHSLLATQVISRVREAFSVEVPLRRLFETPTVAGFKAAVDEQSAQAALDDDHLMALVEQMSEAEVDAMLERLAAETAAQ